MADASPDIQPETQPELNLENVLGDIKFGLWSLFNNPEFSVPIAVLLTVAESLVLKAVIHFVPYTEIDYSTYMQQIGQIEAGELDYAKISGDTGPIVYPGGHVYIYSWMKWFTSGMDNVHVGQQIFRYLYLATFVLTLVAYFQTNVRPKPYVLYFLCLSKRLHSIYVLRLFNDCFATFLMVATIRTAVQLRRQRQDERSAVPAGLPGGGVHDSGREPAAHARGGWFRVCGASRHQLELPGGLGVHKSTLPAERVRLQPCVPVSLDGQLEIRAGARFPQPRVPHVAAARADGRAHVFRGVQVDQ
ncbi:hypothetical protein KL943_003491 [Ogataea angusta]|nr:hypothetical protein KL943_003491 [Ogataea angusta]